MDEIVRAPDNVSMGTLLAIEVSKVACEQARSIARLGYDGDEDLYGFDGFLRYADSDD